MVAIYYILLHKLRELGLWRMIAWGEGALTLLDGAIYFVKGNSAGQGPSYYLMQRIPGGLHTYGASMLILGALIFYTSARKGVAAQRTQFVTFVLAVWISTAVAVSWYYSDAVTFGAITKWFFIAWVALSLYLSCDERRIVTSLEE